MAEEPYFLSLIGSIRNDHVNRDSSIRLLQEQHAAEAACRAVAGDAIASRGGAGWRGGAGG
jgi:hypothetical protein